MYLLFSLKYIATYEMTNILEKNVAPMSHVGARSGFASGSNTKKQVEINHRGQIVGEKSATFSTFIGSVTRTHCPLTYNDWRMVPNAIKDNIWSTILVSIEISAFCFLTFTI